MDVINVNTNHHVRIILLNIIRQSMKKELNMNATCVNTNLHDSHIKSKHEGVRYECDQCNIKLYDSYPTDHIKSNHEEVRLM